MQPVMQLKRCVSTGETNTHPELTNKKSKLIPREENGRDLESLNSYIGWC